MDLTNLTSVIFNDVVNDTHVCYHLVYPKNFNLVKKTKIVPQISGQTISKKRRRRGRPRKSDDEHRVTDETAIDDKSDDNIVQFKSTRYGRVSRPPKHMSKFVDIKDARVSATTAHEIQNSEPQSVPEPKKIRKNVDKFTCGVCKKVYLGRKKLLKHYIAFPDHKDSIQKSQSQTNGLSNGTNSFLFDELMKFVGRASQTERISMFLAEISNFVNTVHLIKPKILQTEQGTHPSTEYYVDKNVSKILELPEGLVQLNDKAFDDNVQQNNNTFGPYIKKDQPKCLDRPTDISNLQPLGYNLNLFPQVNEVSYDQITDNAVEAELGKSSGNDSVGDLTHATDIPLDMFSFNNINNQQS
ncbi:uncharacterized protein LOC116346389 [Contarinia nasturtii]|uniref:uncharacterized protein LOC116346389 n=1 Tax=Contarinia nasturtii TaxID=265458 RepID=UPI0012D46A9A|nr:uncharacterized protein LOC116346389 [Contarinia nasturtii]